MKLGFFTMPIHPVDKDWRLSLKEDREAFLLADELGFNEAYVGEHVTDKAENITSCIAFGCMVRCSVRQIKLSTGTVNMPAPIRQRLQPRSRCDPYSTAA
jgi:hypothetical protein